MSKPHCSISPAGFACVFASLACLTLAVGVGFAMTGAWLVLPFSGLEVLVLGAAFVMHTRDIARAMERCEPVRFRDRTT